MQNCVPPPIPPPNPPPVPSQKNIRNNARFANNPIHASRMGCDDCFRESDKGPERISIHASRMGCDPIPFGDRLPQLNFNPRIPYGMRHFSHFSSSPSEISIHASRMGCDSSRLVSGRSMSNDFNPRIPYGMRLPDASTSAADSANFNPRIPYGMRPMCKIFARFYPYFNPRIPYGMRLLAGVIPFSASQLFQSTHPVWDATPVVCFLPIPNVLFQSTHPVWDATRVAGYIRVSTEISIHASRMGCDLALHRSHVARLISIHASRMGCDWTGTTMSPATSSKFQSTHPVWDATV